MRITWKRIGLVLSLVAGAALLAGPSLAETTLERARAGETIRMGFSNEAPYAYPDKDGSPIGFVNEVGIEILHRMGIDHVEPVVTEWGSLIPGLNAGRFDIITAGMYIMPKRCQNVAFTEPMGVFAEAFMVKKGNPKNLHSFEDLRDNPKAILVTGAGYSTVEHARKIGIPEERIMQVPDLAAMLQAVKSGRADAASATVFAMKGLVAKGGGDVELAKPFKAPDFTKGYSAYAFRKSDQDFVDAFNAEMAKYLGTEGMLKSVAGYGYGETELPMGGPTTDQLCKGK